MKNAVCFRRSISVLFLLPLALFAQEPRVHDLVPLKNWPAPLYWQPSPEERAAAHRPEAVLAPETAAPPSAPLVFIAITPCRVMDTRQGQGFTGAFGPPSIAAGLPVRTVPMQSSSTCSIPAVAQAYSLNVTVVPPASLLYITLYPATAGTQPSPPNASTLNAPNGGIVANAAIVPAGSDAYGSVDVYASNTTDLIIDINGYYSSGDTTGDVALGIGALSNNSGVSNSDNTALGQSALQYNTSGIENTASGFQALQANTAGDSNTAMGYWALLNSTGTGNAGFGASALRYTTSGNENTGLGRQSLLNNTTGSNNIAIGYQAGINASPGASNNIYIGALGVAADSGVTKIGYSGVQTEFFAAGIQGVTTGSNNAVPVLIDSNGQLGTISSSRRYKEDIQDMGDASSGLLRLRPVTFRYKKPFEDGTKPVQYGLIAEEVEEVYPDLVARSADGKIETVKYQLLDAMLLNELQKQADKMHALEERLATLETVLAKSAPAADRQ